MKELIIPFSVIAVIVSLILPLPMGMVDFLLVGNLVLALILLVSALYVAEPIRLSALPSMLLLATLYRLGLNVSTTRMILSRGEAGQTIEAFGSTVIAGSLVVGVVIFLLITLVQFLVIAKGAERVAEVAARFTLDALPGKQMSIDADVRAGLLDAETARAKRDELQVESRFYGALDGAMKFIKGDAIAGIVIAVINILGGLTVGIALEGLDIASAVSRYTTLTIGDGLVSQIPALLNSLAAGMVVTRVHRGDGQSLCQEMFSQLGQTRRIPMMISGLTALLAFLPGMPSLSLLVVALVLFVAASAIAPKQVVDQNQTPIRFQPKLPPLWQIELGSEVLSEFRSDQKECLTCLERVRQNFYNRRGLILPAPDLLNQEKEMEGFAINLRGIRAFSSPASVGADFSMEQFEKALDSFLERNSVDFVDDVLTRRTVDALDAVAPELVSAVVPGVVSITQLTELLRLLVIEGISIRNFDMILQSVAEVGPKVGNERIMLEEVRIALRRQISSNFAGASGQLTGIVLDPVLDLSLVKAERARDFVDAEVMLGIEEGYQEWHKTLSSPPQVVVASRAARRLLRDCLRMRGQLIPVIAHEEISDEVKFVSLGVLELKQRDQRETLAERLAA